MIKIHTLKSDDFDAIMIEFIYKNTALGRNFILSLRGNF
jgi:hypothetical protein